MTEIEKNVLEAIIDFKAEHEYSPTVREICVMTDKAVATVADVLKKLEANGYISTDNYKARTIKVLKGIETEQNGLKPCPFCGKEIHILYMGGGWFWEHKVEELYPTCPITHSRKYNTREEAIEAWERRVNNGRG